MSWKKHLLLRSWLLLAIATIRAAAECPPSSFNFFPDGTINQPGGWTKANQTIAGNSCNGHLLPIATYGFPKPLVHFQPSQILLTPGASVLSTYAAKCKLVQPVLQHASVSSSSSGSGSGSTVAAGNNKPMANAGASSSNMRRAKPRSRGASTAKPRMRSLLAGSSRNADAAGSMQDTWTVVRPALYNVTVTANGKPWFQSGPFDVSNGDIPVIDFAADLYRGRRDMFDPTVFHEGINTVLITVTMLQGTGSITDGTTELPAPFIDEYFDSPPIDFYFFMSNSTHDSRPKADVTIHSCSPEVSIHFRDTAPGPILIDDYRLTYTPSNTSQALFLPTYYVYGSFERGWDGSTGLDTDNTEGNIKTFGLYVTRLPGSPDKFSVTSDQLNSLKEGWYSYTVEGSIWGPNSQFDSLVEIAGADVYSQKDTTYISIQADGTATDAYSLFNGFKGAGWVLPEYNQTRVGIQRYQTWLNMFEGPTMPLTLGSKATFEWEFSGLGNTSCEINGVNTNPATGTCRSPLMYTIATTLNQTLVVKFKDVCDVTHSASMTFGTFGWEVNGGSRYELGGKGALAPATMDSSLRRNGAGAVSRHMTVYLLGFLAAFWLTALLLI